MPKSGDYNMTTWAYYHPKVNMNLIGFFFFQDNMPAKRNTGIRSQWSNEQLQNAIFSIRNGMSKNTASKTYNVPRRTLVRYLNKNSNEKVKLGRKPTLTLEEENELKSRIIRLATIGYPLSRKLLRKCVYNYCHENNIPNVFSSDKKIAGRFWLRGFLKRNPEISVRKAQSMNPARAQKLNKFIVGDYFTKLRQTLLDLDLMDKPEKIFNIDEKGCRLSLHHQQNVLAQKGTKRVHLVAPEHGQNVTIVACGSASGVAIPPCILFKGCRMKQEWKDNLPPESLVLMSPKGSMNVKNFKLWLEHFAKYKPNGRCLLIFDGAKCHLDHTIVDIADRHEITLFCFPSNTTHELQPMDKSVFRSFEHHWDEQVLLFWTQNKDRALTKQRFGPIFSVVWDKCMTPANIKSGFRATGIYPFSPDAIPEEAFAPSLVTEKSRDGQETPQQEHPFPQASCSYTDNSHPVISRPLKKVTFRNSSSSSESSGSYSSNESSDDNMDDDDLHVEHPTREAEIAGHKVNQSFTEMLKTPDKVSSNCKIRKRAINSRAVLVKKNVFLEREKIERKPPKTAKTTRQNYNNESWYCNVCNTDAIMDMRRCSVCSQYVHEECVGLTKEDKEIFICPNCSD